MMKNLSIEFRSRSIRLSELLQRRGLESLQAMLAPYQDRLSLIYVRFTDVNGPRSGEDTVCSIQLNVAGHSAVYAEHRAEGAWEALGGAARRVRTLLERATGKERRFAPMLG